MFRRYDSYPEFSDCNKKNTCDNNFEIHFRFTTVLENVSMVGKTFDTRWNVYLSKLDLLNLDTVDDRQVLNSEPIIVTAVSSNHFREVLNLLYSLSVLYNGSRIIYIYDLGLR